MAWVSFLLHARLIKKRSSYPANYHHHSRLPSAFAPAWSKGLFAQQSLAELAGFSAGSHQTSSVCGTFSWSDGPCRKITREQRVESLPQSLRCPARRLPPPRLEVLIMLRWGQMLESNPAKRRRLAEKWCGRWGDGAGLLLITQEALVQMLQTASHHYTSMSAVQHLLPAANQRIILQFKGAHDFHTRLQVVSGDQS
jgi:hypothetical protein